MVSNYDKRLVARDKDQEITQYEILNLNTKKPNQKLRERSG